MIRAASIRERGYPHLENYIPGLYLYVILIPFFHHCELDPKITRKYFLVYISISCDKLPLHVVLWS